MTESDLQWMQEALKAAQDAANDSEVPVGAVVVCDGKVVGRGRNRREKGKNVLCHAELEAIDQACKTLGGWRLHRCDLYVTMEPCLMCAGAILHARIRRVVYGVPDLKFGAFGSITDVNTLGFTNQTEVLGGVMEEESRALLQAFFADLRQKKKEEREGCACEDDHA